MVVLDARDPIEAIRLRATRPLVIRRGEIVAEAAPAHTTLKLEGRPSSMDRSGYAPKVRES